MKRLLLGLFVATMSTVSLADTESASKQYHINDHKDGSFIAASKNKHGYSRFNGSPFKCFDAWHRKIKGRFNYREKSLIELAGGNCRQAPYRNINNGIKGDLTDIYRARLPVNKVHYAIRKVRKTFNIPNSRFVKAERVKNGNNAYKYTLIYKVAGQGIREFRIKHDYWSGNILKMKEV